MPIYDLLMKDYFSLRGIKTLESNFTTGKKKELSEILYVMVSGGIMASASASISVMSSISMVTLAIPCLIMSISCAAA